MFDAGQAGALETRRHNSVEAVLYWCVGSLLFAFNYGNTTWRLPATGGLLLGQQDVAPQDVAILNTSQTTFLQAK